MPSTVGRLFMRRWIEGLGYDNDGCGAWASGARDQTSSFLPCPKSTWLRRYLLQVCSRCWLRRLAQNHIRKIHTHNSPWPSLIVYPLVSLSIRGPCRAMCSVYHYMASAMCFDDQVTKVSRIVAVAEKNHGFRPRKSERRLQQTVSVAGTAHGVSWHPTVPFFPSLWVFIKTKTTRDSGVITRIVHTRKNSKLHGSDARCFP